MVILIRRLIERLTGPFLETRRKRLPRAGFADDVKSNPKARVGLRVQARSLMDAMNQT